MDARSYSEVRGSLRAIIDEANASRAPILITRRRGGDAVLIAKSEWDAMVETLHLLQSPANAARLAAAVAAADAGDLSEHDLAA